MVQIEPSADAETTSSAPKTPAWAWGICWLMFASTVLNYMDRQSMALVGPSIRKEFHLNAEGFGWVLAAFYLTYAVFQVPAGYLVDRWNVRLAYAGAVAWWSLAGMAAAFAPSLAILMVMRGLLGVGESFNWPCALRVTGRILPPADRSLGNGIFNSGAAVGAVLTPLTVPILADRYGWRTAFLVVGTLGFLWVVLWLTLLGGGRRTLLAGRAAKPAVDAADDLAGPRGVSPLALGVFGGVVLVSALVALSAFRYGISSIWWGIALLMIGPMLAALALPPHALKGIDWLESLGEVVRLRRFWVMVAISCTINVCWHFQVNWLPTYFKEDRQFSGLVALLSRFRFSDPKNVASGWLTAMIFLAADAGNLGGGALMRHLAARGMTPARARTTVMMICTLMITGGTLVGIIGSDVLVVVLVALMAMGTAAFMANYFSFAQEVSTRNTGLVVGLLGGLGNLFAAGMLPLAGMVKVRTGSFAPIFVCTGLLPYVGMAVFLLAWGAAAPRPNSD